MAPLDKSIVKDQLEELGDFHQFFTSKELRYLPDILNLGERICGVTSGFYDSATWVIVITNARIVFLDKGMFHGLRQIDLPLSQITAVKHHTGYFFGELEVSTSSGTQKITKITKGDVIKIASIISGILNPAPAGTPHDIATQLEKIGDMYERGLLSDAEFQDFKMKLLE